jgi:hypothetical protein
MRHRLQTAGAASRSSQQEQTGAAASRIRQDRADRTEPTGSYHLLLCCSSSCPLLVSAPLPLLLLSAPPFCSSCGCSSGVLLLLRSAPPVCPPVYSLSLLLDAPHGRWSVVGSGVGGRVSGQWSVVGLWSVAGGRWSVVGWSGAWVLGLGRRSSVVGRRWSAFGFRLSVVGGRWSLGWLVVGGGWWGVGGRDRRWSVASGRVVGGWWSVVGGRLSVVGRWSVLGGCWSLVGVRWLVVGGRWGRWSVRSLVGGRVFCFFVSGCRVFFCFW